MAVGKEMVKAEVGMEEKEKWLMHYSSFHQILLVGEGDFSFSLCLAQSFSSASNIVATSLNPYGLSFHFLVFHMHWTQLVCCVLLSVIVVRSHFKLLLGSSIKEIIFFIWLS